MRKRHEARWHSGAARIALEAGVPLVPADRRNGPAKRLGPLRVAYGAPLELGDLAALDAARRRSVATERLREAITALERGGGPESTA